MLDLRRFVVAFAVAFALAGAGTASAYHTNWIAQNCNWAAPTPTSYITRDGSITVALYARNEGYQWGGGCWNDNDVDDSPGDPKADPNTGGEGPDCSGFTFKVWREAENESSTAFHQWWRLRTHPRAVHRAASSRMRMALRTTPCPNRPRSKWTPMQARPISE